MRAGGGYISTALKLESVCLSSLYRKATKRPKTIWRARAVVRAREGLAESCHITRQRRARARAVNAKNDGNFLGQIWDTQSDI